MQGQFLLYNILRRIVILLIDVWKTVVASANIISTQDQRPVVNVIKLFTAVIMSLSA
jgi:hypothetical protein